MIQILRDHWLTISILSALLLLTGTGCVADRNRMDCPSDTEEYSVTFNLQVPSMQSSLRSVMTPAQERAIDNLHIFVFKQTEESLSSSDDGKESLAYVAEFVVTRTDTEKLSTRNLAVRLKKPANTTTEFYRLVFIANRDLRGLITDGTIREGMTKNELRVALEADYDKRWETKSIPMWGETNLQSFDNRNKYDDCLYPESSPGVSSSIRTIHLIRALARVDVGVSLSYKDDNMEDAQSENPLSDFKIKSVAMYRYATKYSVMATQANHIPGTPGQQPRPTLPNQMDIAADNAPLSCVLSEGKDFIAREIYIPERSAGSSVSDRPCIIIGAYYGENNTTDLTYYRLDFIQRKTATPKDEITPLDILRNHRYSFNITKVLGPGTKTPEEALIAEPINIQCDVRVWDEGSISAIAYDGQYWLTVSRDKLKALREGGAVSSDIQTSWPKGFKIESLPDFVTADVLVHEGTDKQTVQFTFLPMGAEFAEGQTRTGEAIVRAGRITWPLKFEQVNKEEYSIAVYSDEACTQNLQYIQIHQLGKDYNMSDPSKSVMGDDGVVLSAEQARAKVTFYVKAKPIGHKPEIYVSRSSLFDLSQPEDRGNGVWKYTVTAEGINLNNEAYFETRDEAVRFRVTTSSGKTAEADLTFFQQEYNAIPYYDSNLKVPLISGERPFYLLNGERKDIFVKANTVYTLKLKGVTSQAADGVDEGIVTFETVTSLNSSLQGLLHQFTTNNDFGGVKKFNEGTATFEVSSPTNLFPTREFTVRLFAAKKQPEANTYLIKKDAQQRLMIPLSRINTAAAYYKALLDKDFADENLTMVGNAPDYYLKTIQKDSRIKPRLIWTNIGQPKGLGSLEGSGIKIMQVLNSTAPNNPQIKTPYLLVELEEGCQAGEVLVGVYDEASSDRALLWSWLIWVVDEYPTATQSFAYKGKNIAFMDRAIGARQAILESVGASSSLTWEYMGYQFQFGRKDPFPSYRYFESSGPIYYDAEGAIVDFKHLTRGNRSNFIETTNPKNMYPQSYTLRGSIEHPASIVAHETAWLYEATVTSGPTIQIQYKSRNTKNCLWSSVFYQGETTGDYWDSSNDYKTPFDPSPYGFTIPSYDELKSLENNSNMRKIIPFAGLLLDGDYDYTRLVVPEARGGYLLYSRNWRDQKWAAYYVNKSGVNNHNKPTLTNEVLRAACAGSLIPITYKRETDYADYLPE